MQSSLGINQPIVGQPNKVFARVTNLGWQYATGVIVKFWWANPSLAITESSANLIGTGWADIPSGWSIIVEYPTPWIPVVENGGHECLIAEAYIPVFDPLTVPMDPVEDRHVGQKNEQLVTLGKGQSFKINIHAANVFDLAQSLTFEIQPLRLATINPPSRGKVAKTRGRVAAASLGAPLKPRDKQCARNLYRTERAFRESATLPGSAAGRGHRGGNRSGSSDIAYGPIRALGKPNPRDRRSSSIKRPSRPYLSLSRRSACQPPHHRGLHRERSRRRSLICSPLC